MAIFYTPAVKLKLMAILPVTGIPMTSLLGKPLSTFNYDLKISKIDEPFFTIPPYLHGEVS